mmetsp:Transcript_58297/g.123661  ORF Transcript_58297/g.123661 Transcript_58297/m.123661 type:complete len:82 (+) Transcript_58297:1138-1383(+)
MKDDGSDDDGEKGSSDDDDKKKKRTKKSSPGTGGSILPTLPVHRHRREGTAGRRLPHVRLPHRFRTADPGACVRSTRIPKD